MHREVLDEMISDMFEKNAGSNPCASFKIALLLPEKTPTEKTSV